MICTGAQINAAPAPTNRNYLERRRFHLTRFYELRGAALFFVLTHQKAFKRSVPELC